jgi:hypothetical protein
VLPVGGFLPFAVTGEDISCYGEVNSWLEWVNWNHQNPSIATASMVEIGTGEAQAYSVGQIVERSDPYTSITYLDDGMDCYPFFDENTVDENVTVAPKIDSISPSRGPVGSVTSVIIYGAGFPQGSTVHAGTGITVTITQFNSSEIHADFNVASSAPAGNHAVKVVGPPPTSLESNSVNFLVRAVPTNFRQTGTSDAGNGVLHFDYAWDSSSGNLSDLSDCSVSEKVVYPGGATYSWPAPFPIINTTNPTILSVPGSDGTGQDNHGLDGKTGNDFRKPYFGASFTAQQTFSYSCGSGTSQMTDNLLGPLPIERSVSQNPNSSWRFTVTKPTDGIATINPLPN